MRESDGTFATFYREVFLAEHQRPANVALHVFGTLLSSVLVVAILTGQAPWWSMPLYPVVHALPGLVGHRFFERNRDVGDLRVTRTDYSPLWFIAGNHRMTFELLTRGFYWRDSHSRQGRAPPHKT